MERVPYLDLRAQYNGIRTEVLAALGEICQLGRFAQGPATSDFETKFAAHRHRRDENHHRHKPLVLEHAADSIPKRFVSKRRGSHQVIASQFARLGTAARAERPAYQIPTSPQR